MLPEVFEAMRPFLTEAFGNPSSLHRQGLRARKAMAVARDQVAAMIGAESAEEILFTSGGTEAANLAVKGAAEAGRRGGNHIVVSATEHPAVLRSAEWLEKNGFALTRVPVDSEGRIEPDAVRAALTEQTILLCAHHANHDIGTIQPIPEMGAVAAERGIPFFVDATASGGWVEIDVRAMGADLLSLSPHRFGGPKGAGVLYRNRRARVSSQMHGGEQEGGRRAGTENVAGMVGAGAAAVAARRDPGERIRHARELQKRLWDGLGQSIERIRLNGAPLGPERLPGNLHIGFEFVESEGLVLALDMAGVAIAGASSCTVKAEAMPHVLAAIGLESRWARGSVLISIGKETSEEDVDYAAAAMSRTVERLREMSVEWGERV